MKIAFDLRCLQTGYISGIETYALNLAEGLLNFDKTNQYVFFRSGVRKIDSSLLNHISKRKINFLEIKRPNKILNIAFKTGLSCIENYTKNIDLVFMPNLNVINLQPKTKLAITIHDLSFALFPEFFDLKRRFWHFFINIKKMINRADVIFAVSEFTKYQIEKIYGINSKKIEVIYPGLKIENFKMPLQTEFLRQTRNALNLPSKYFLFLNTLEPRKNLISAILAFENLNFDHHLVIAGKSGWKTSRIYNAIKKSKAKNRIHFLGYVDEKYKPALYNMSTALLYPSFYEGFGFQAIEAVASGVPVIASQITSLPEILKNSAILVNPFNIRDLQTAMLSLTIDKDLPIVLKNNSNKLLEAFSLEKSVKKMIQIFQNL